ncbi:MAG: hypothetical protein M1837_006972 [Sclerophora amabilis]|nr:MAG: hypothetical protein M1837_006972 [Sclerophora amabilis]
MATLQHVKPETLSFPKKEVNGIHREDSNEETAKRSEEIKVEPYKGWPNDQGWDGDEDFRTPVKLHVQGTIPAYAAGVLYRTGPGGREIETSKGHVYRANHWFDGFSQVHRFQIVPPTAGQSTSTVTYNSRSTVDEFLEEIRRTGSLEGFTFARKYDPCQSYFKKVMSTFFPSKSGEVGDWNIGVTLSVNLPGSSSLSSQASKEYQDNRHASGIQNLFAKTDTPYYKQLDPETLEPVGLAKQSHLHPDLKGDLSAAHAKSDPVTGDVFNYNLEMGYRSVYRVFRVSASTGQTTVLASIRDAAPAYLHSLFLTGDHVLLCVWNSHYTFGGSSLLWHKNILDAIGPFDASKPAKWYVIDRHGERGVVATYESDPFFCFHTINAWEEPSPSEPGTTDIVADLTAYPDLSVLKLFYYENVISTSPSAHAFKTSPKADSSRGSLYRFRLASIQNCIHPSTARRVSVDWTFPIASTPELPTLNPAFITRPNRYIYGIMDRGRSTFTDGLGKVDTLTRQTTIWEKHAHSPGEAIFIANPDARADGEEAAEDDGVLLSVVLDGEKGASYLLCLDARDMTELGRAEMNSVVGFGFHGCHFRGGTTGRGLDY